MDFSLILYPFLWRVAKYGKQKTNMVMKKKLSFIETET